MLGNYFKNVSEVFEADWKNKNSNIYSSKYIAAFCSLFIQFKTECLENRTIREKLENLKSNIIKEILEKDSSFDKSNMIFINDSDIVPDKKSHQTKINGFLKNRV
jgi:hypothetical protein